MAILDFEETRKLKDQISQLNEVACKQVLYGFCEVLLLKPSVLGEIFRMYVEDGLKYTRSKEGR